MDRGYKKEGAGWRRYMFEKGVVLLGEWEPWEGVHLNERMEAHKRPELRYTQLLTPAAFLRRPKLGDGD